MNKKNRFYLFIIFVFISLVVYFFSGYFGITETSFWSFVSYNHNLFALVYTLIFIILSTFSFSVTVLIGVGVLFFSKFELFWYAITGVMISSIIHFYLARKLGRDYVLAYLEKREGDIEKFKEMIDKSSFKTILILSAIFFVPPSIPNYLGGIIKINFKKYFIATFLGNSPIVICAIYLINGLMFSNASYILFSTIGLGFITIISLFFYKGEIKHIMQISFPRFFKK